MAITDNTVKWEVSKVGSNIVSALQGATAESDGGPGYVPAPKAGDNNSFLKGDGTWSDITLTSLGITASAEDINTIHGVTAPIQAQLNDKLGVTEKAQAAIIADSATTISTTLEISKGGTGAITSRDALINLGILDASGKLIFSNGSKLWVE